MGQSSNDAAVKNARIISSKEDFALSMGQKRHDAAVMDAQIKLRKEECASSKRCSSEGCTSQVQNGGVCKRHGAKVK